MATLAPWLLSVKQAINSSNGKALRQALRLDSDALMRATTIARTSHTVAKSELDGKVPEVWHSLLKAYIQTLVYVVRGERQAACREFREEVFKSLVEAVQDEAWVAPAVVGAAISLKTLSEAADDEQIRKGMPGTQLTDAGIVLQGTFGKMVSTRPDDADKQYKRSATVAIVNMMFKIYFKQNTITNCRTLINNLDKQPDILQQAPLAYRVTYRYYTGRLAAYDELFKAADTDLTYAFQNCPLAAVNNRRKVLRYLVPVKMLLGVLPAHALLERYGLTEFVDIASAMRSGDVGLLMQCMEENQIRLVESGTYLLLEKLLLAVYRRLFKKCTLVHAERPGNAGKGHQVERRVW